MPAAKTSKRFSSLAFTAPTAGEVVDSAPAPAPASKPVAKTPRRPAVQAPTAAKGERIAFTWRLTPEQADQLDTLALDLRRQLGRGRLDRATVLQALVDLATNRPDIQTDLTKHLDA